MTEIEKELRIHIMHSGDDLLASINNYIIEKEFNYSAMVIIYAEENKLLIFIPRRYISDRIYEEVRKKLLQKHEEIDILWKSIQEYKETNVFLWSEKHDEMLYEIHKFISELYNITEFILPLDHDIIINGILTGESTLTS